MEGLRISQSLGVRLSYNLQQSYFGCDFQFCFIPSWSLGQDIKRTLITWSHFDPGVIKNFGDPFRKMGTPDIFRVTRTKSRTGILQAAFQHISTYLQKHKMEQASSCQHSQLPTWRVKPQNKDNLPAMSLIDTSAMDATLMAIASQPGTWICPECERNQHTSWTHAACFL